MRYKLILAILIGFACQSLLEAQPRYDVGFQGGPILSTIPGFANSSLWKLSGQGGVIFTRRDNKKNYAQLEINIIRKGAWRKPEVNNPDKINFSLYYIEAPLLYRFENLKISRRGKGGWEAGLSYAYLVSPQLRRNGELQEFDSRWSDKYDLSALAGVHIIYGAHLMFRTRFAYSINPILRRNILPNEIENFNSQKTHNVTIQFGLVWLIRGVYY